MFLFTAYEFFLQILLGDLVRDKDRDLHRDHYVGCDHRAIHMVSEERVKPELRSKGEARS